jgi:hypothetical protein
LGVPAPVIVSHRGAVWIDWASSSSDRRTGVTPALPSMLLL